MTLPSFELLRQVRSVVLLYPDDPQQGMSWLEVADAAPSLGHWHVLWALQDLVAAGDLCRAQTAGKPARYYDPSEFVA